MDLEKTREALLLATLPQVTFDGWTQRAIDAGADEAGLDRAVALNAFPGGPVEMLEYFGQWADAQMLAQLEKQKLSEMRVRDRVATAVQTRLGIIEPHREAVRRGLSLLAVPPYAPVALKMLYRTVDAIWYAAGDNSTDYNFYTKRMLLAGVYSSTLLYWLNDGSEDYAESWAFLDRRISEVLKIGGRLDKTMKGLLDLPDRVMRMRPGAGFRRSSHGAG